MQLGIVTPVVTALPGAHAKWEQDATIEDISSIAEEADRLGYEFMTCSEHVAIPEQEALQRGGRYWDPLATFGYLAARTERIRFATYVLVLGYHHPLEILKRYGTLDQVSGGRLILGVGIGSLTAEFDLLGADFDDRAARADDTLQALRAGLAKREPSYSGRFYSYDGVIVEPCAQQPRLPIWVGGRTRRSLDRAIRHAQGWCPFGMPPTVLKDWLQTPEVPAGFEICLQIDRPLDPIGAPAEVTHQALAELADAGATSAALRFIHHSRSHFLEQLHALVDLLD